MGKTDVAYDYIKKRIIDGDFPPLSDLSEDKLQKEINVSRTPVREAILRLEKEDFLYVYPRKGIIVTDVTRDMVEDIYEIRELIEARLVISNFDMIDREWLLDIRKRFLEPPKGMTLKEKREYYIKLDTELHDKTIYGCRNRYLRRLMKGVYDQNQRLRMAAFNEYDKTDHTISEHVALIDAILAKDKDQLRNVVGAHLKASKERIINQIR